jgi:hypothetical protein
MSETLSEILRPTTAENQLWSVYDPGFIDDDVLEPEPNADGLSCAALIGDGGKEQVWALQPLERRTGAHVERVTVRILSERFGGDTQGLVRVRIAGQWTDPQTFTPGELGAATWSSVTVEGPYELSQLDELAVGVTALLVSGLMSVLVLYVEATLKVELLDTSGDLAVIDGTRAVTLYSHAAAPQAVQSGILGQSKVTEAAPSLGQYRLTDANWFLPKAEVSSAPSLGSVIEDPRSGEWIVLAVHTATLGGNWRCLARKLDLESGLAQRIHVQRANWLKGPEGDAVPQWETIQVSVPAALQLEAEVVPEPKSEPESADPQLSSSTEKWLVYVSGEHPIQVDDRIVYEGRAFDVTQRNNLARRDELSVLVVNPSRWPLG